MGTAQSKDYEEIRLIGKGGFGKVTLVRDKATKELLALKKIKLKSDADRQLALQEGRVLFELRHEHLVHAKSFFEKHHWFKQNKVGILMEYCDGGDLGRLIEQQVVLTEAQVTSIMLQVSDGLMYLHDKGILHRDIKPENILLKSVQFLSREPHSDAHVLFYANRFFTVKVSDLGVSANLVPIDEGAALEESFPAPTLRPRATPNGRLTPMLEKRSPSFTSVQGVIGTRAYMAPEVRQGKPYSYPADVYSFGLVCAELLSRERVWVWKQQNKHVRDGATAALLAAVEYSSHIRSTCLKLQDEDAAARPTMKEFRKMLTTKSEPATMAAGMRKSIQANVMDVPGVLLTRRWSQTEIAIILFIVILLFIKILF